MTTPAGFRRIALKMPGTVEGAHTGHPDFRAGGRVFATLRPGGERGMIKLNPERQREFVRENPAAFSPENGAWGRQGCTKVVLASIDEMLLAAAMTLAWKNASEGPPRKAKRSARPMPQKLR
jgi:hypothetical protein